MSDHGRQSLGDKFTAAVKPDSSKTTTEHFGDKFKGNADSLASTVQPQHEKSGTQRMGDKFSSNQNENHTSLGDKVKNVFK